MSGAVNGHVEPGFEKVADAFAENFESGRDIGAACSVYLDGRAVVDLWGGLADRDEGRGWERDTIVLTFSSTKGATAVCANRLMQEGRLDPDAPVAEYWPEFAANGKAGIPVRWVLSHRAGLPHVEGDFTLEQVLAWDPVVEALAAQAPVWEPGTAHGYHARSYGWLTGEIVRRVTGQSLGEHFAEHIASPLTLAFYVGLPESEEPRVAHLYPPEAADPGLQRLIDEALADQSTLMGKVMSGPSNLFRYDDMWNTRPLRAAEMPSSNGIGDARSLARMYAACVGEVDGVRLLSDDAVARATVVHSSGDDCVLGLPLTFGLGFSLPPTLGPGVGARSFGHAGAGGSLGFADPDAGLGFGYVMNKMWLGMTGDARTETLVAATYACL